jgi:hypothetical protein
MSEEYILEQIRKLLYSFRTHSSYGWKHVGNRDVNDMELHYEFIFGGNVRIKNRKGVEKDKIYTEFHTERGSGSRSELLRLRKMLEALPHDDSILIERRAAEKFDVRCTYAVPVFDENGAERAESDIIDDLTQQLAKLKAFMDDTLNAFVFNTGLEYALAEKRALLESSKQLILTGAPGTGKTFTARGLAEKWIKEKGGTLEENFCQVQFHPGYDYSDFIIGLKPKPVNGKVIFDWKDGLFKKFAQKVIHKKFPFISKLYFTQ